MWAISNFDWVSIVISLFSKYDLSFSTRLPGIVYLLSKSVIYYSLSPLELLVFVNSCAYEARSPYNIENTTTPISMLNAAHAISKIFLGVMSP